MRAYEFSSAAGILKRGGENLNISRGPRKRPKRVGIGKSGFDSSSYAEFFQEHDQHLTLDVWWPNHE